MLGGHEAFLHISDLQVIQRQHVLLLFLLRHKTERVERKTTNNISNISVCFDNETVEYFYCSEVSLFSLILDLLCGQLGKHTLNSTLITPVQLLQMKTTEL